MFCSTNLFQVTLPNNLSSTNKSEVGIIISSISQAHHPAPSPLHPSTPRQFPRPLPIIHTPPQPSVILKVTNTMAVPTVFLKKSRFLTERVKRSLRVFIFYRHWLHKQLKEALLPIMIKVQFRVQILTFVQEDEKKYRPRHEITKKTFHLQTKILISIRTGSEKHQMKICALLIFLIQSTAISIIQTNSLFD